MKAEPLGNGVEVFVSERHRFNTDTVLLAHFAGVKNGERVAELGTGCGTIPLIMIRESRPARVDAVDIQPEAIELLTASVARNTEKGIDAAELINPILGDIRDIKALLPAGGYDLVVCNPPYKAQGSGLKNPDGSKTTARHEVDCALTDVMAAAKLLLRFGGRFVMCQRPERLTDVLTLMREHGLEPKRLRFVQGRADKAPKLFLVEAKRGARTGYMDVMPTLMIEDEGGFTDETRRIYGSYKEGH